MNVVHMDYEQAELLMVSYDQRRSVARRWVWTVLAVQAGTLLLGLIAHAIDRDFWSDASGFGVVWMAYHWMLVAATVLWPTSVVLGPMIVAIACLLASESRRLTIVFVLSSIALTGVPLLIWLLASNRINGPLPS